MQEITTYKYIGAIHIHSVYSDGTGDIHEITKSAKKAGLSWIIITDHNNIDIEEGIINDVCVIKAEEVSKTPNNHYLAMGLSENVKGSNPVDYIKEIQSKGGFGFAAHPDESMNRQNSAEPIRWLDKRVLPDGVEIWNWFSQWADNYNDKTIFNKAYSFLFKDNLVDIPYNETLKWWDNLNINSGKKIIPAIGGIDAHALKISKYLIPIKVFNYTSLFKTICNVIELNEPLKDDFKARKEQILNAIKYGNNIIINRKISKKAINMFISNNTKIAKSGENIILDDNTVLNVELPIKSITRIIKDGFEIDYSFEKKFSIPIKKAGKYRIEVEVKNKGFAYTNPIVVLENEGTV